MDYSTDLMKVNLEILESALYNTEVSIPKLKITVEFDDDDKYKRFIGRVNPTVNQEDDELMSSDEEENNESALQDTCIVPSTE